MLVLGKKKPLWQRHESTHLVLLRCLFFSALLFCSIIDTSPMNLYVAMLFSFYLSFFFS